MDKKKKRIGVFICHCGKNIKGTVDVDRVVSVLAKHPDVVHSDSYKYMCSDPGQKIVQESIKKHKLDGVVVAACSPTMHEPTFRSAAEDAGINPYMVEMANIREQVSWVHSNKEKATEKAIKLTESLVEKVRLNEALVPIEVPVNKKVLVIGAGIAGIQAALDLADQGFETIVVEKQPSIGGHMAQLSETFPTLDCSQCILTPKMVSLSKHPNIRLMAYSEVQEVTGYVGNFKVKILKNPSYVIPEKCTSCGDCVSACPVVVDDEFNKSLSPRKAIYLPFPQAVPSTYTLDTDHCLGLTPLRCGECQKACLPGAIDYDMAPEIIEETVGAIIVATGYEPYGKENFPEYGYGKYLDVIDSLTFERILSASGPTDGAIMRPSDGKTPKKIVFIQCAGSRDPELHKSYCSKICCMYTAKHAFLYKHEVHDGEVYVFYIDIRAGGKRYEEFIQRVTEEERINYLRGKVSKVFKDGDQLVVWGADTITGRKVEIKADLVVLATAMVPTPHTAELVRKLKISADADGFLNEAHPKLRPVESLTAGIFLAGSALGPADIPDAVALGSGAASKACAIVSKEKLYHEPLTAQVNEDLCSGCGICVPLCPYDALSLDSETNVSSVNEALCEGCGTCVAACPSGAIRSRNFADGQILKMIGSILKEAA